MVRDLTLGNPPISVTLRHSGRARRLSLRVSRLDGKVSLTVPPRATQREAMAFLKEREDWLRGHLSQVAAPIVPRIGGSLPFRGQDLPIVAGNGRRAQLAGDTLAVPDDVQVSARIRAWLKLQARDVLTARSDHYAAAVGRSYDRISLRDTRSRWGSCSSKGTLMYSWRLIMAPPEVLDYVAAHEVAHLVEMNHSPRFWAVVSGLMPDWKPRRDWLRHHGSLLHQVALDD